MIACDECGTLERVDECVCVSPARNLCVDCHRRSHPVKSASKFNWGELDRFEGRRD